MITIGAALIQPCRKAIDGPQNEPSGWPATM
jgi:hypothetical protein